MQNNTVDIEVIDNHGQEAVEKRCSMVSAMDGVADHYRSANLTSRILAAIDESGLERESIDVDSLSSVDEFHLGGRAASEIVLQRLGDASTILDVGSGIGGFARLAAHRLGANVVGIDLTPEFVETANDLTALVGLAADVDFSVGSAADIGMVDGSLDAITLLHVGMNIADKTDMFGEFARVLRPAGKLVVYDIMRTGEGEISFPVPWASTAEESFVDSPASYRDALVAAGFGAIDSVNLRQLTLDTLAASAAKPPAAVNLGHLMGERFPEMFANLMQLVHQETLSPTLIVAAKG